jgi:hypothetical protein
LVVGRIDNPSYEDSATYALTAPQPRLLGLAIPGRQAAQLWCITVIQARPPIIAGPRDGAFALEDRVLPGILEFFPTLL